MADREENPKTSTTRRSGAGGASESSREQSSTTRQPPRGYGTQESEKLGNEGGSKGSGGSSHHR